MRKQPLYSPLALAAAATLGFGGLVAASPAAAAAADIKVSNDSAVQSAVYENLSDKTGKLSSEVGRFGVDGDKLVVGVSEKSKRVKAFSSKYDNVEVVVNPNYTRGEAQASKDLVGGAGYFVDVPSDSEANMVCSTGFAGWDAQGNQVVLTAGHCAVDTTTGVQSNILDLEKPSAAQAVGGDNFVAAKTGAPGSWGFHQFGSEINGDEVADEDKAIDFAVMKVADGFTTKPEVTDWTSAKDDDLSKSTKTMTKIGTAAPGSSIAKSGRTTGVTQGTVSQDAEKFEYANISGRAVHGFAVDSNGKRFSDHGDSGGAVYQGDTAVGFISGGAETGEWSWVADLKTSLALSGASFTFEKPGGDDDGKNADATADKDGSASADAKDAKATADKDGSSAADAGVS